MPIRFKLVVPGLLILLAAMVPWLVPGMPAGPAMAFSIAAAIAVAAQWMANERWVLGPMRSLRDALGGQSGSHALPREWRDVVVRVAGIQAAACERQVARDQATLQARRVQEALQASEERYALAVRGANDGLWECELDTRRLLLSPRWKHMLGLADAADIMSVDDWTERVHPLDRAEAVEAFDAHVAGRADRFEHAHRLLHADGRYRWVLSRGTALRHASGSAYRVVGLDTDITRLKRVESIVEEIAAGTAGRSGEPFFQSLVQHFARALHIDCAFITECMHRPPTRARTLAFWRAGRFDANFEYELAGTPCEGVLCEGRTVFHSHGLAQLFPREAGQESYLGLPILARDGSVIGHLAFLDRQPMESDIVIESVYRIFTARAAVELELSRALQRLETLDAAALAAA